MMKEFSISARDHLAGVTKERLDAMASKRSLPFVAVEMIDVEENLRNFLLRRASAVSVERAKHSALTDALLVCEARIWRNSAAMQSREEAMNCLDPVEALNAERNGGYSAFLDSAIDNLEVLPIAQRVAERSVICTVSRWVGSPGFDGTICDAVAKCRRGFGQHDNAGVLQREPKDGSIGRWCKGVNGEIAIATATSFARSTFRDHYFRKSTPRSLRRIRRCGGAIPRRDRMALVHPDGRSVPMYARSMHQVSSRFSRISV
jgi:hypothetical protein